MHDVIEVATHGRGFYDLTSAVESAISSEADGVMTLFVRHTSCSLLIQENYDPDVKTDLAAFFERLVPDADDPRQSWMRHRLEGPDDMPAHIKAAILPVSLTVPVTGGRLLLGTWQGIFLVEHRVAPHQRQVAIHLPD